jgi:DNA mismatch endonuclease (patch repair protein)
MQGNRSRDTRPEAAVRSALHRHGFRFRKHAQPLRGLRCQADIIFSTERVAVFVDGCFWHGCPEHGRRPTTNSDYWRAKIGRNIDRDRRNDQALAQAGWTVVRAWEHEPVESVVSRVAGIVKEQRAAHGGSKGAAELSL